jgi:hypothetical protein
VESVNPEFDLVSGLTANLQITNEKGCCESYCLACHDVAHMKIKWGYSTGTVDNLSKR